MILKEETKLGSPIGCLFYEFYDNKEDMNKLILKNSDSIQCVASNLNLKTNIQFGQTQCPNISDYADNNDTIKFLLKIWWYLNLGTIFDINLITNFDTFKIHEKTQL